jgi:hypothetical protein
MEALIAMTSVDVDKEQLALGDIVKRQRQLDALATLSDIEVDVDPRADGLRENDA